MVIYLLGKLGRTVLVIIFSLRLVLTTILIHHFIREILDQLNIIRNIKVENLEGTVIYSDLWYPAN